VPRKLIGQQMVVCRKQRAALHLQQELLTL
jgi:hypothetical protein